MRYFLIVCACICTSGCIRSQVEFENHREANGLAFNDDLAYYKFLTFRSHDGVMFGHDSDLDIQFRKDGTAKISENFIDSQQFYGTYTIVNDSILILKYSDNYIDKIIEFQIARRGFCLWLIQVNGNWNFYSLNPFRQMEWK